jgi:hypothetical protein
MGVFVSTKHIHWVCAVVSAACLIAGPALACSSCGCTLNSDWASQGYSVSSGWSADIRQDYYEQAQLRSGTSTVDRSSLSFPRDEEVQTRTINRTTLFSIDDQPSRNFGINLQLPYFDRSHSTIAEGDTQTSSSHSRGIGDLRILARYQGFSSDLSWGVQFGLKLPTGRIDDVFLTGPQSGATVDRGLQPGTGSTDVLLGLYRFGNLDASFGYFFNAIVQAPVDSRDGFKPGTGLNVSLGIRYFAHAGSLFPQLQLNLRTEKRETGVNADNANSGATLAYLTPGMGVRLAANFDAYGFIQVPVYQRVNGLQIEPRILASLGLRYRF